jgi:hypothetical protein
MILYCIYVVLCVKVDGVGVAADQPKRETNKYKRVGMQREEERPSAAARPRLLVITREVGEAAEEQVKREVDAEDVEVCTEEEEKK